ncbi:hypothetical protein Tco_0620418 [Tanacetum coccineum]
MASPDDNLNTTTQAKENNAEVETNASTADQQAFIVNRIKALQALVNQSWGRTSGMRLTELDFEDDDLSHPFTGSEYVEDKYKDVAPTHRTKKEDLSKPFKEVKLKSPFSSRAFMYGHKCPKLLKKFADKIPRTVDEMMERVDDFLRSEEAYDTTEAPRGEVTDSQKKGEGELHRRLLPTEEAAQDCPLVGKAESLSA